MFGNKQAGLVMVSARGRITHISLLLSLYLYPLPPPPPNPFKLDTVGQRVEHNTEAPIDRMGRARYSALGVRFSGL